MRCGGNSCLRVVWTKLGLFGIKVRDLFITHVSQEQSQLFLTLKYRQVLLSELMGDTIWTSSELWQLFRPSLRTETIVPL